MTIDRTLLNALEDDDGTGLVGSVINKALIADTIFDPVDAALAADVAALEAELAAEVTHAHVCEGRLTLTTGVPVTTADVSAATAVYFTPYRGNRIALYSGSTWVWRTFAELTIAIAGFAASTPFDVFAYDNAGTVALETVAWASGSARATALALQDGVYVKSGAATRRYLGSFFTSATGQTEDSVLRRLVWNYYHRAPRLLQRFESTSSWTYTTASWRAANNGAANSVSVMIGVAEDPIDLSVNAGITNSAGGASVGLGIGYDTTTAPQMMNYQTPAAGIVIEHLTVGRHVPAVGFHWYAWCEISTAAGTTTWYAYNIFGGVYSTHGLTGRCLA